MLFEYGVSPESYAKTLVDHDRTRFTFAVEAIAKEAANRITVRNLDLLPVHISMRHDPTSGKTRPIGHESPWQQVFDTIAVFASEPVWKRRIVPQQVSSIKKRGPIHGIKIIKKWVQDDNRAIRYAQAHGIPYASKCKYHDKNDVKQCFPSARLEVFMALFRCDCANQDLLWLWETLLTSHRVNGYQGFLIGSLVSQWAMQYMLSFAYRYAMSLATERRGKRIKLVQHMLLQMDDVLFVGSNRKNLKSAIRKTIKFVKDKFGLIIKPNWHIKELSQEPIDIMGFVVHRNGKVTIRARNYIHGRRLVLTYYGEHALSLQQARRLTAFKGFFKHSKITYVRKRKKDDKKLYVKEAFDYAASIISNYDKGVNNGTILRKSTVRRTAGSSKIQATPGREGGCLDSP